jgi:hypothetical protein
MYINIYIYLYTYIYIYIYTYIHRDQARSGYLFHGNHQILLITSWNRYQCLIRRPPSRAGKGGSEKRDRGSGGV